FNTCSAFFDGSLQFSAVFSTFFGSGPKTWCHVRVSISENVLDLRDVEATIMVSRYGGRHVLPRQKVRASLLPPDRRKPLGSGWQPPAGAHHLGPARATPSLRPARCSLEFRCPLRPQGAAAHRASARPLAGHSRQPPRPGPGLRTALGTKRLPGGARTGAGGAAFRVCRGAGRVSDGVASAVRPGQRP